LGAASPAGAASARDPGPGPPIGLDPEVQAQIQANETHEIRTHLATTLL
jgi:hypothetical protein